MSGQVQIRDKATAWTDHFTDPRGASYRGAVPAAVSLDTAPTSPPRKTGAGKHRAIRGSTASAIKRAISRSMAVLAPHTAAIPAAPDATGSNPTSVDPTVHGTAPIRPAEIAARHDQPIRVPWLFTYSGPATPVERVSATGATREVQARHDYISDSGHSVYGSEPSRVQHVQATPLGDAALARGDVLTVPGGAGSGTASASESSAAELRWRAEWLESRQAQVQERPSSGQVIVRQNPSVSTVVGG